MLPIFISATGCWSATACQQVLVFVLKHTGLQAGLAERFGSVMTFLRDGHEIQQELVATRCSRGAEITRLLRFPEGVAAGIYSLDEHFNGNGNGKPARLQGEDIPLYSRMAPMTQVVDVFNAESGRDAALKEVKALRACGSIRAWWRPSSRWRNRLISGARWPATISRRR